MRGINQHCCAYRSVAAANPAALSAPPPRKTNITASSPPKVHLQVCRRGGETPGLGRNGGVGVGCRVSQKRNNHKRGKQTRSGCRSPETTSAGIRRRGSSSVCPPVRLGPCCHGDGSHGGPLAQRGTSGTRQGGGVASSGSSSQDGDLMISPRFSPRGNFWATQTRTVHTCASCLPARQKLLTHRCAAAGQVLRLFLGLFAKTLITLPRCSTASRVNVGDVTSTAAAEIKVKLRAVT